MRAFRRGPRTEAPGLPTLNLRSAASRARSVQAAALGLALALALGACDEDECEPVEDLAGSWTGTLSLGDGAESVFASGRDGGVAGDYIQLIVDDTGNRITGFYSTGSGNQGTIDGLQNGSALFFEAVQTGSCSGTFDGTAEVCGREMKISLEGEDCNGDDQKGTGRLRHTPARTAECNPDWIEDGECDEPQGTDYCAPGTDTVDCYGVNGVCLARNDGVCDEPSGTGLCPDGTDVLDCRGEVGSGCEWRDDGVCDEPSGTGLCGLGEDPNDCAGMVPQVCPFTHDGICDEPQNGGSCPPGSDFNDCSGACPFTNDGFCDEFQNGGSCPPGSDFNDCQGSCPFFGDGVCDEPEGTGNCIDGSDSADCPEVIFCATGQCTAPTFTGGLPLGACCMGVGGADDCGLFAFGRGSCFQPEPIVRSTCQVPPEVAMFVGAAGGCCRSEGVCGIDFTRIGLGCAPIDASPLSISPVACDPTPGDDDAGAP